MVSCNTFPVDLVPHTAQGTLTFDDGTKKFSEGDEGTFTVTKRKDKDETQYDVEVDITYFKKEGGGLVGVNAVVGFASYEIEFYTLLISTLALISMRSSKVCNLNQGVIG